MIVHGTAADVKLPGDARRCTTFSQQAKNLKFTTR